jgi:TolB-like protein/DNA-binding winged helix-turn-helix (wHTH) protein/Tfp pilus assembly protein PilF
VLFGAELMPPIKEPVLIGDWLADPRDDSLTRGNERVKLEPRTMRLLMRLAQAPGIVVSQDELLESVWTGLVVGPASVYQSMSQLRKMLGDVDEPARYIETVARKGYRLVAKVSKPETPASATQVNEAVAAGAQAATAAPEKPAKKPWRWIAVAAAVGLAVLAALWQWLPRSAESPQFATIAVLPFLDLTEGHTQQLFCDGLTEEMSNWLAQVPTLRVVARTSASIYADRKKGAKDIGRELNTTHLLYGSLRRSGNKLRITVQLVDTGTGFELWTQSYDEEAGDVLKVQETIARKVAGNLELRVSAETDTRFASRRSNSARAYELFLNARANELKADSAANDLAITLYREALRNDPQFALAKVWLAHAISNLAYYHSRRIEDLIPEALPLLAEAETAVPQLADTFLVRGLIYTRLRERELAEHDLRRAIELNPSSDKAADRLGYFHMTGGKPHEALRYFTITAALNPLDFWSQVYKCIVLTDLARLEDAEQACAQARALGPSSPLVYSTSSSLEAARMRWEDALRYSRTALDRDDNIAAIHAERASWLRRLGLLQESGEAFREAVAADANGARRNVPLLSLGGTAAIDRGGATALQEFVREFQLEQSDDPRMMFELASLYLMVNDPARARTQVDRALASDQLRAEDLASPWLARSGRSYLLILAATLRPSGDPEAADRRLSQLDALLERLHDDGMRTSGLFELRAQAAAMRGRGDEAVAALSRAAELGWTNVWLAEHEPYFASLRDRPDYRAFIAAARARNASAAAKLEDLLPRPAAVSPQ